MKNRPIISGKDFYLGFGLIAALPLLALLLLQIPMSSNSTVELPFLDKTKNSKILMFGGYPDCSSVCPLSMQMLKETYTKYQRVAKTNDLQILFVNIELNTPEEVTQAYAQSFHRDFLGYSATKKDIKAFYTDLAMRTYQDKKELSIHQGYIYLLTSDGSKWKIKHIFKNNVDKETILSHLLNQTV